MCIIIHKPVGLELPNEKTLETCFWANPDGAGYMLKRHGQLTMAKGFMRLEELFKAINMLQIQASDELAIHFRITTSGGTRKANCHPFPITRNTKELKETEKRFIHAGLMHNGVIGQGKDTLSDTMLFVRDTLSREDVFQAIRQHHKQTIAAIENLTKGSRLLLMQAGKIGTIRTGNWIEEDGIFYSNGTYKSRHQFDYAKWYQEDEEWDFLESLPDYFDCPICQNVIANYDCDYQEESGWPMAVCPECENAFFESEIENTYELPEMLWQE